MQENRMNCQPMMLRLLAHKRYGNRQMNYDLFHPISEDENVENYVK